MHTYGPQGMQSAAPRAQMGPRPWNPSQVDDEGANGHLNRQESQRIALPGRSQTLSLCSFRTRDSTPVSEISSGCP